MANLSKKEALFLKILNILGPLAGLTLVVLSIGIALAERQPRYLPISSSFVSNGRVVQLEVASKPQDYARGLKFRRSLPEKTGMLFILNSKEAIQLWMKDIYIPLDIIFLSDGVIKTVVEAAPPCKTKVCPNYSSVYSVNRILELPSGSARSLNLQVNKKIEFID